MKFDNRDRHDPGFKQLMRRARPGQHIAYHQGLLIDDREHDGELDQIARFVVALYELGLAKMYQKRIDGVVNYFVVLRETLSIRKDQSGTLQEAERLMEIC